MSIHFEVTRTFNVSKERTYDALLDLDAAKNWMQGFVGIERLDEGPIKEGSEWKETRKMFGKEATERRGQLEKENTYTLIPSNPLAMKRKLLCMGKLED